MKVFVTGATGFIGTAIVQDLIDAGHQVLGLARSDAAAQKLVAAGAEVHRGDLEDTESLRSGAAAADGVIHAGFIHDFSRLEEICRIDKIAIETIGDVLAGTNKPFLVASGTALANPGKLVTEDVKPPVKPTWPRASEQTADEIAAKGVRAAAVRLSPSVHGDDDKHGFIPILVNIAREKGVSAYIGDGQNRWNAVHRLDAVKVFRLALENTEPAARYHAVAEEGITVKEIAEALGKELNLPVVSITPEDATEHFGWFAYMAGIDCPASSEWTQQTLGWAPTHSALLQDIANGIYTK